MSVLVCSITLMGNQGLFLQGHVKVADLQNRFWTCCLLTIEIGFLPMATKLPLPKQFQGSCVVMRGECQIDPLNSNRNHSLTLSLTYSQGKDDLSHAFLMSHFIVSSLPPFENCQGSVEDDISQRGKKISCTPYLLFVHEKHSSTALTLSSFESVPLSSLDKSVLNLSPFLNGSLQHHDGCKENSIGLQIS